MFDNLRDSASSSFYEEEPNDLYKEPEDKPAVKVKQRRRNVRFLGLSSQQRFILSFMIMILVCTMGMLAMFVMEKMALPF